MASTITIVIRRDGSVEWIGLDSSRVMDRLGTAVHRRASHVEPVRWWRRVTFRIVRAIVSDVSRMADWTRGWHCDWQANIIGGPILGPFSDRGNAIKAEVAWLMDHRIRNRA